MYRSTTTNPSNKRVFGACLLSFAILITPIAALALPAEARVNAKPAPVTKTEAKSDAQSVTEPELPQAVPVPLFVPGPAAAFVASLSATLTDDIALPAKKNPGDIINYTATITNAPGTSPADDASGVAYTSTLDTNTTLVPGSINVSPLAFNDAYTAVGNTLLEVGNATLQTGPQKSVTGHVTDNDVEFLGDTFEITAFDALSSQNGTVTMVTSGVDRGSFTYISAANFTGTDTFTYTIRDDGTDSVPGNADDLTGVGTVTITVANQVWYIDSAFGPGGDGRSTTPFDSLADVSGASGPDTIGDIIYVNTATYAGGITLLNTQTLHGEGTALVVGPDTLAASGADPTITNGAGSGVTLASGNTLTGFTVGNTTVYDITNTTTATVGSLTITNVVLNGSGNLFRADSGGALTVAFESAAATSAVTTGILIAGGTTGSFSVAGTTAIDDATTDGISISASAVNATFTGALTILNDGGANGDGVDLLNNSGIYSFNGGTSITVNGAGAFGFRAQGSGTVNIVDVGTTQITSAAGTALLINPTTLNATLDTITSGGGADGISLAGMSGSLTVGSVSINGQTVDGIDITNSAGSVTISGGTIGNTDDPAGAGVDISGGAGNVTIDATINKTSAGDVVEISGRTGGTVDFNANLTSSAAAGVDLSGNTSGIIRFDGGMTLSTSATSAFSSTASTGGTVIVTDPGGPGSGNNNVLTTTTATALNITNTTIGTGGVNFQSISSNGGSNDGIILNTTGSTAGLTITGNGGTCTSAATCTGGAIQNKTGADSSTTLGTGIFLNSTSGVSLTRMQFNDFQNHGIKGTSVTGFSLTNSNFSGTSGTSAAGGNREGHVHFDGLFTSVAFPTATIDSCNLGTGATTSFSDNLRVFNTSGTLDRLIVNNTTFGNISSGGNDSMVTAGFNNGTVMKVTVTDCIFINAIGSLTRFNTSNNSTLDLVFRENKLSNNNVNQASGGGALSLQTDSVSAPTVTYDISCNRVRDSIGIALLVAMNGGAGTSNGSIINNVVGVTGSGTLTGSTQGSGIKFYGSGSGTHNIMIANNDVRRYNENGIFIQNNNGSSTVNASVFGNIVAEGGPFTLSGLNVDVGALGADTNKINVVVGSVGTAAQKNDFSNGDPANAADVNLSVIGNSQINLSKNGSGSATAAAVIDDNNLLPANTNTIVSGTVSNDGTPTNGEITLVTTLPTTPPAVASCSVPAFMFDPGTQPEISRANEPFRDNGAGSLLSFSDSKDSIASIFDRLNKATQSIKAWPDAPGIQQSSLSAVAAITGESDGSTSLSQWFAKATSSLAQFANNVDSLITPTAYAETEKSEVRNASARNDVRLNHAAGRRTPVAKNSTSASAPMTPFNAEPVNATIGTLPAGKSVTIKYAATIAAAPTANTATTQGTITATSPVLNFMTNDPDPGAVGALPRATVTNIKMPDLTIVKSHSGTWKQGDTGKIYTITVTNSGDFATFAGTPVSVSDTVPSGLTATGISGTNWTCTTPSGPCTRTDSLGAGASYEPITLTVNVDNNAPALVTNTAVIANGGGGEVNNANNSDDDPTTIVQAPDLTIDKAHVGNFFQGQTGAQYTITVGNAGPGPVLSGDTVTVTDTLPVSGFTATSISGTGWVCTPPSGPCTRSGVDTALPAGNNYPDLTLTGNVAANAPASITNSASVSGGGEINTANNSDSDPTTVNAGTDLIINKSHTDIFTQGDTGKTYSIQVTNVGGTASSGTVTVSDTVPTGLTPTAPNGAHNGWTCTLVGQQLDCSRFDSLGLASSYPLITLTVNVSGTAPPSVTNTATVSGGNDVNLTNNSDDDPTTINGLCSVAPANMTNWWTGDNTARDIVGGKDGALRPLVNGATYGTGKVLNGFQFDGVDDYVEIGDVDFTTDKFTIDAWVNPTDLTSERAIVSKDDGSQRSYFFHITTLGALRASVNSGGNLTQYQSVNGAVTTGSFQHVAVTYDGAAPANQKFTFYVNGVALANLGPITQDNGGTPENVALAARIGRSADDTGMFLGVIDEVEFFSRVLSAAELLTIFNADTGGKCKPSDLKITKTHSGNFLQNSSGNVYTITVTNDGPSTTSGVVNVLDSLPAGLTATGWGGTGWTCNPLPGPGQPGPAPLTCSRSDGLAAGSSYPVILLTVSTVNAAETVTNTVTVSDGGNVDTTDDTANDETIVVTAPSISKAFSPTSIPQGGTSTLTFTINNPNTLTALNGVAFSDTLPAGLSVADSSTTVCGGTLTTTAATRVISLSGATIATSGSCVFGVTIGGVTAGDYTNTSGNVSATNGGTGNFATANITVVAAPGFTKSFSPTEIAQGATSTLTFTITNSNATATLTGVGFSDTLPAGLDVADGVTSPCGGTLTTTAATRNITLTGASVAPGVPCTFNVTVTGTTAGVYTNTSGNVTSSNGGTGPAPSAGLTVVAGPVISKSFSPTTILVGATSTLTFTITNANTATTLTGVAFSDTLPVGLSIADSATAPCSGTLTTTAATRTIALSGASVAPGVPCTFNVTVTGTTAGEYTNTTGNVSSTNGGTGNTATANLSVLSPPSISKGFTPTSIPQGSTSTLAFTITNSNSVATLNGVAFSDTLPVGLNVADSSTSQCGGTLTTTAATRTIALSGATVAPGVPCTFNVTVTGTTAGVYTNTTGNVSSTNGGTGNTAAAGITVVGPPSISKSFTPTSIPQGSTSILSFSITNANTAATLTGVGFSDTLPAGLDVADSSTPTCSGTLTTTAATRTISLAGASVAPGVPCNFNVTVTGTTAGVYTNLSGNVTSTNGGTGNTATAGITVVGPPSISKAFSPTSITVGATSTLTFTITNANSTTTLTGVGFTDVLPVGLDIADSTTSPCSGTLTTVAATRTITLSGASVAPGVPCTFNVTVTGTTEGNYTNTTGNVSSTNGGTGNTATANLSVVSPPAISKAFSPTSIAQGGTSTLTFTINNTNASTALNGVTFSDTLPAGLDVADSSTSQCGGTLTTTAATRTIALTGATVAPGVPCTFNVTVTGTTAGVYINTTGNVASTNGGTGNTATAGITVVGPPSISKSFSPTSIAQGSTSTLSFSITNANTTATLIGVGFSDTLPAGLDVADSSTPTCGGTLTTTAATRNISLAGASVAPGVPCNFNVTVTGTTAGDYTNLSGNVTSTNGGTGNTATAGITVVGPPSISKSFSPPAIAPGNTTTLTFTITNSNTTATLTGVGFTDVLPVGLDIADSSTSPCSGTLMTVAATRTITLSGASVAPGVPCTFNVTVTGTAAGSYTNTTGNVSSTNGGTGNTASANLQVSVTLTVNDSGDAPDNNVGDFICDTNVAPGDQCTLRAAIQETNFNSIGGTINFSLPVNTTITLLSALDNINSDVVINGPSSGVTVSGNNLYRVFNVVAGNVSILNLTMANGQSSQGGGIFNSGNLTITNSTLVGNKAVGSEGGAIYSNSGTLTIINSTISGNTSDGVGGGLNNAGTSTATLVNVTVTNNRADADGNATGNGGGIAQTSSNPITLRNTIVAGNFVGLSPGTTPDDINGTVNAASNNNLVGTGGSGGLTNGGGTNNQVGVVDARLGVLASNGGPTQTHALLSGSVALDAGDDSVTGGPYNLTTDQRGPGFPRQADGPDANTTDTVDIGAFEADPSVEDISDKSTNEDTALPTFVFNVGDATTPFTSIVGTSSNTTLVPNANIVVGPDTASTRTLSITPAANEFGTTTITVTVARGTQSMSDTFLLTVNGVNDPPSFVKGPDQIVAEDAGAQSIPNWATAISQGPGNESGQTLVFLVQTNTNPGLFSAGPAISPTGTLTYTPADNANGTATITIALMDNGGGTDTSPSQQFVITVTEVNDAPDAVNEVLSDVVEDAPTRTISIASLMANDNAGPANESGQTLTFALVPGSAVGGTISSDATNVYFTPTPNYSGPASFQYTVTDNGTTNSVADPKNDTATVSFIITGGNDAPTAVNDVLPDIPENSGPRLILASTLTANDTKGAADEIGQTLTIKTVVNVEGGTVAIVNGDVVFTPTANYHGPAIFTYTVEDNGTTNGSPDPKTSNQAVVQFNILAVGSGGVLRFSADNYSVAEGAGFRTITVERSGDTSHAITVDYASSDHSNPADSVPCTAPGAGFASSRCDFTTAIGTLQFAAGETSKTFNVLITNDNYVEGTETLELSLSNPTNGAVFGVPQTAILSITDDAAEPATNPIDNSADFVRAQYHDILNREPDAGGLAFWTDNIEKCNDPSRIPAGQTVPQCIDKQRESTAIAFFMSPEFQMTGGFVYNLFKGSLTGSPNYDGGSAGRFPTFLEFMKDMSQVSEGIIVGGQISGAVVEANRNALAAAFVARPEFVAKYGGLNNTLYVQELFNTTGIAATAAEKQALVDGLTGGESRASVLRKVVDGTVVISESDVQFTTTYGQAFINQENRRLFVFLEYIGYMRRNPDTGGFVFWLGKLNFYNGDPFQAEMVRAFILSPEYRNRFGQP